MKMSCLVPVMAALVLLPGCATAPAGEPVAREGHYTQSVSIRTLRPVHGARPGVGFGYDVLPALDEVSGARCEARNNLGSWSGHTPVTLEVRTGGDDLAIECRLEGYRAASMRLHCMRPGTRSTAAGALAGLQLASAFGPLAVYAAPGTIVAALVGAMGAGAAVGRAVAGPHPEVCDYGPGRALQLTLTLVPGQD